MRLASALSERTRISDAFDDAADQVADRLGRHPDVLFVFASARLHGSATEVPRRASARFDAPLVCGCTGVGVLAAGRERERTPALALLGMTLPDGARARPIRVEPGARRLDVGPRASGVVLFADPFSADIEAMLRTFDASCRDTTLVGALASGARRANDHALFLEGWTFNDGAVGVALSGNVRIDSVVAQSCRPIGEPMIVTRADGPRILELDRGRPTDVLRELAASLGPDDRRLMREGLFCGVEMRDAQLEYGPGDFLMRDVVAVENGALVIASRLEGYPVVQLHVRDARASAEELARALRADREAKGAAAGALLFPCRHRGIGLYGEPDRDSHALADVFGPVPTAGFFGNGEVGPSRGSTYLHRHTSAVALLRASKRVPARG